jgi:hypothetical protein
MLLPGRAAATRQQIPTPEPVVVGDIPQEPLGLQLVPSFPIVWAPDRRVAWEITMVMVNSPLAAGISYGPAVFGLVGSLIGGLIAGVVSFLVARQAREAAEHAWIRDNRREIYDRFLTCGQRLLVACEARRYGRRGRWRPGRRPEAERAEASVESANIDFFGAYVVVQTVADTALVAAARVYMYRLWELKASLDSTSVMGRENFDRVAQLIRVARHDTINAMRAELGLGGGVGPAAGYNPFVGTDLEEKYASAERDRPGYAA